MTEKCRLCRGHGTIVTQLNATAAGAVVSSTCGRCGGSGDQGAPA